ncbi:MAG TPA: SRPBCC family protein [Rudaea sp.]
MRFLKGLIVFLILLVVVLLGVAFVLPGSAHVERSVTINRPPAQVFAVLNSYRRFNDWSPWAAKDPNAKYQITGPASGVGAKESWQGDPKTVGSGSQEIIESTPDKSVTTQLDFGEMGKATARYLLTPESNGAATKVVWTLDTQAPLALDGKIVWNAMGRYMGLFMDKMVGPDYEQGLARLKALVESFPAADIGGVNGEEVTLAAQKIYFISASADATNTAKEVLTDAYMRIGQFMGGNTIKMVGAPLTITTSYQAPTWTFDAAIPVDRNDVAPSGDIKSGSTYAGKAVQFVHIGPYDRIGETITKAYAWLAVQGYKPVDRMIEEYVSDPGTVPAEQLQTRIKIPVQ